jgi:hypothetical protein
MTMTYPAAVTSLCIDWSRSIGGEREWAWAAPRWVGLFRSTALEGGSPELPLVEGRLTRRGLLSPSRSCAGSRYAGEDTPVCWLCALGLRESHGEVSSMNIRRLPLQTYFQVALYHQSCSPCSRPQSFVVPSLHQLWNVRHPHLVMSDRCSKMI